jgi:FAD/FMN-containing dehydrogenase
MARLTQLSGWGRYPAARAELRRSDDLETATLDATLSRGLGRAYGDAAVPASEAAVVVETTRAARVIRFDSEFGVLRGEAGLSLEAIHDLTLPAGWACPVLPGTQFVTLGGMVAADVHGKNHHVAGTIGAHVLQLRVRVADGRILDIGPLAESELFYATLGGMGLTGHILEVELKLERIPSSWIDQETESAADLAELLERLRAASRDWPMTVAWSDGLAGGAAHGRGILIKGRWLDPEDAPARLWRRGRRFAMPIALPDWTPRRSLVRLMNTAYYHRHRRAAGRSVVPPLPFFHPLDVVGHWNRFYGRSGFTQYQCVLPDPDADLACQGIFRYLTAHGSGPLLAVIKDFGAEGRGLLSFPTPGITLSLDLPIRLPHTIEVVAGLNELVANAGGRIYLAKDSLTDAMAFRRMEIRLDAFNSLRDRWDPERRLRSALSVRLMGDPE